MTKLRSHRCGYVLVLTLGLLALAAISLSGLARYSLGLAATSREAAEALQRRWGLLSLQHVVMQRAAEILDAQVPPDQLNTPPWPKPARFSATFDLGGQAFSVHVSDEDAKANLNTIHARKADRLLPAIRHMSRDTGAGGLQVRLTPQKNSRAVFGSWGQVFQLASVPAELDAAAELKDASREITCWGSGRLNLRRASDAAVREVAGLVLPAKEVGQIIEHRKHWGGHDLKEVLAPLALRRGQLLAVRRLLADESRSYSMWVQIDNGQRTWSYQYVDDGGTVCFAW